jgi:biopolymer transport protein ExbB
MLWPRRWDSAPWLLAVTLVLSTVYPAGAQDAGKVTDQAKAPTAARKAPETLLELIVAGGPLNIAFLSVLGLFSLVALTIILERSVNLTARKLIPAGFVRELQELIRRQKDDREMFRTLVERYPSAIANILKACLLRAGRPVLEIEKAMEDAAARELAELRGRVRPLTVLSSVGPLVGLLGTAVGMILVFRTASEVGPGKAELLAEGIYLKLETTVAGLIVAIPCVLFAALFNSRSEKLLRRMDEHLMETIPCFARMEHHREERREERSPSRNPLMNM